MKDGGGDRGLLHCLLYRGGSQWAAGPGWKEGNSELRSSSQSE